MFSQSELISWGTGGCKYIRILTAAYLHMCVLDIYVVYVHGRKSKWHTAKDERQKKEIPADTSVLTCALIT